MSAYYDLFEKPDVRQTGEQQSLYARFVPKGTIDRKEFIERVHLFTGLSRSLLEGAMAGFMDGLLHPLFELYPPGDGQERASCCLHRFARVEFPSGQGVL